MVSSGSVNSWEFRGCSNSAQGRDKKDNFVERVRRGLLGVDWVTPHHLCSPFEHHPPFPNILLSLRSKRFHPLPTTVIKIWPTRRGFKGSKSIVLRDLTSWRKGGWLLLHGKSMCLIPFCKKLFDLIDNEEIMKYYFAWKYYIRRKNRKLPDFCMLRYREWW